MISMEILLYQVALQSDIDPVTDGLNPFLVANEGRIEAVGFSQLEGAADVSANGNHFIHTCT